VEVAGELGVGYVACTAEATPTMQNSPVYENVVAEVGTSCASPPSDPGAGVTRLWLDPGIGFGKTVEHNWELLAHCDFFVELARQFDAGVLIGTSRKSFLAHRPRAPRVEQRLEGSIRPSMAMLQGVSMVRVT